MSVFEALASDLQRLDAASRRRRLMPRTGTDFSSNDYLALAGDPA
ncbi:MAG: 8-amino-7-oxononanoate synthase, partial [Sphingosinicella sp.]|nr:8-amino-7-oxononanoate synthase [Sphingosinicella sp.]